MATFKMALLLVGLAGWSLDCVSSKNIHLAKGNGVIACRPGVEFPRDCGNRCQCAEDGKSATCTNEPCPTNHKEFDEANRKVYKEMDAIKSEGLGPVFRCEPFSERPVNNVNGFCYCAKSGQAEICSTRIGDPWGIKQ